jgi:hypothetical protein
MKRSSCGLFSPSIYWRVAASTPEHIPDTCKHTCTPQPTDGAQASKPACRPRCIAETTTETLWVSRHRAGLLYEPGYLTEKRIPAGACPLRIPSDVNNSSNPNPPRSFTGLGCFVQSPNDEPSVLPAPSQLRRSQSHRIFCASALAQPTCKCLPTPAVEQIKAY